MKHLHIICLSLVLFYGLLGFVSCTSDTPTLLSEEGDDRDILLTFRTAVAGASTRAGEDNDDNVNTLRIVIVSQGKESGAAWTVEHNSKVSPTTQEYSFKVAADSRKRIYLIANEDGLADTDGSELDFSDESFIPKDDDGKAAVDEYVFGIFEEHPYTPSALPMTAMYEIEVPAVKEVANSEYPLPDPLYLVRAATKFSFEFTNQSTERNITVTGIDVKQVITDRMYLMPHVNTNGDGKYWVVKETVSSSTFAERVLEDNQDWVDWMEQEVNKSKENKDDEWLTDYEIPAGATAKKYEYKTPLEELKPSTGAEPYPKVEAFNAFYLPESRTEKGGDNTKLKLQEYSITVHTTENGEEKTYPAITLPHLSSLFRSTHVVVSATFTDYAGLVVDVIPYSEVPLEPSFGVDVKE